MSEAKLNIKEETSAKKTRSPPKKAKVEQSILIFKIRTCGILHVLLKLKRNKKN